MLLSQKWIILSRHVFHETNDMADELAKRGRKHQCNVREYNECPNFVYVKYVCDILQLSTPHEWLMDNTCNSAP